MNSKPPHTIGQKFALFTVLPAIVFSLLALTPFTNAGDREDYQKRKTQSSAYKKPKKKGLFQALVDHHRKERSFILGLITGGDREYHEEKEYYKPAPVRDYQRQPVREYKREPVRESSPEPVQAPEPAPRGLKHQYPGYSGY